MSTLCFNGTQKLKNILRKISKFFICCSILQNSAIFLIIYNPQETAESDTFYPNTPISLLIQTAQRPRWDPANTAPGTYHPSSETSYPGC
mmetsp:Transcript_16938/g.26425  ORF Transcript_16938/g.26425 Transcript_16938/m.26425 type:complete len:90 (-) Transcript_16938:1060-1329(-)